LSSRSVMKPEQMQLQKALSENGQAFVDEWLANLSTSGWDGERGLAGQDVAERAAELVQLLSGFASAPSVDINGPEGVALRQYLETLSRAFATRGLTSSQTAAFVFSLKKPLFARLQANVQNDAAALGAAVWKATELLDELGLFTVATYQKSREEIIRRQQEEMLELSTPVVKLWEGVLALPMIGTLDSSRTQVVMESLLQRIVETGSEIAIIDITGVPTVDTLVAQHLLKTVTAIRLLGADCIISGIRPQIAQTIVHLGIDLEGITTKASLADALALALKRSGFTVARVA
jgi:rsbT co-antagonist protein RsbR